MLLYIDSLPILKQVAGLHLVPYTEQHRYRAKWLEWWKEPNIFDVGIVSKVENDIINICYLVEYEAFKEYKNINDFQNLVVKQKTNEKKVEVLKRYEDPSLKAIFIWNFDETVISLLPEGDSIRLDQSVSR